VQLVIGVFVSVLAAAQEPAPEFRLPKIARPTRYHLDLAVVPSEPTFHGFEVIDIDLLEPSDVVWLNAKDLTIQEVNVTVGKIRKPVRWHITDEFLAIELPERTQPGPMEIGIRYVGKLDEKSNVGAYRRKSGNDWYVYTAFTPIDARRAFLCFDEPGYKAPWEIVLHVKRDEVAVSNAPAVSTADEPEGMKRVVFAPTQPLASEVVAFAVGPFDMVDAGLAGQRQIPVRIITPRGRAAEAEAARTATPEILSRLEQYTGIPYPWEKLDHLVGLELPFGGIENPGLIIYGDQFLLAPPNRDTPRRQRRMREVMAHELAHQWFGNLVTQEWWDDVWLSEGFATWLGTKISDLELPAFERGLAITDVRDGILLSDTLATRPLRLEMHSRKETENVYDQIIYFKGASILEMLEDWLGAERFQRALHRYLVDHRFATGTSEDLARAIEEETGVDVRSVLFGFLDRPGAPILRFSLATSGQVPKLEVEQDGRPWSVPVCIRFEDGEKRCEVVSKAKVELQLPQSSAWVWPNAFGSGYYRSVLAGGSLGALIKNGYNFLEGPERLSLVGDLEGLTVSGTLPAAAVMRILPKMTGIPGASEPRVEAHINALALQLALVSPEAIRGKYAEWVGKTMDMTLIEPQQTKSIEEFFRDKEHSLD
jgi:cytosol alanyl aminopeptidase